MTNKTQYPEFEGFIKWPKVYEPDEFRGSVRWSIQFYPTAEDLPKFKEYGIQKKENKNEEGVFFNLYRPVTKLMGNKLVYFTPPAIFDADGKSLITYTDETGKWVRSYEDKNKLIIKSGDTFIIGNGSKVKITLSVYPTSMGNGNRLESIKILDLVAYEKQENPPETKEEVGPEIFKTDKELNDSLPPW